MKSKEKQQQRWSRERIKKIEKETNTAKKMKLKNAKKNSA